MVHQIATEIRGVLDLVEETLSTFGFTQYEINLSTRPEKSVGEWLQVCTVVGSMKMH